MFGGNRTQQSSQDRPVVIDGRTGKVITDERDTDTRDTGRGQGNRQGRGTARFVYGDDGRPVPYWPDSEF